MPRASLSVPHVAHDALATTSTLRASWRRGVRIGRGVKRFPTLVTHFFRLRVVIRMPTDVHIRVLVETAPAQHHLYGVVGGIHGLILKNGMAPLVTPGSTPFQRVA